MPATDERMRATIEAIARDLTEDVLVLRYRNKEGLNADGLTGEEGTLVICSFWLVACLAQGGEVERAERLFDQLAGCANDIGLLAEEIDTTSGEPLGNSRRRQPHRPEHGRLGDRPGAREGADGAAAAAGMGPRHVGRLGAAPGPPPPPTGDQLLPPWGASQSSRLRISW